MSSVLRVVLGTALILLIPLAAMQLTDEVNWDGTDFLVIGVLLFATGLTYEFGARALPRHRLAIGVVLFAVLLYLWAELAVGVFTNWGS